MLVEIPQPYDFELSTSRFRNFGSDRATVWHDGGLHRVVGGTRGSCHRCTRRSADRAVERRGGGARSVGCSGSRSTSTTFRAFAAGDPVLGAIVETLPGFRPTLNPQPFEALVVAITTQQISLRAAAAIRSNFVERFGVRHEHAWEFPTRERMRSARPKDFTVVGFSRAKAEYVLELAHSAPRPRRSSRRSADDDVIEAITAVRGLGRWTADWFLARHLARPTAWPAGDLGLRKAVSTFYADGRPLSIEEVRRMGERFAPFQNLSAQFLLAGARMHG